MLANLAAGVADVQGAPPLLAGTGSDARASAGRGDRRPGPVRRLQQLDRARRQARGSASCSEQGKQVKLLCVGRKGRDALRRELRRPDRRTPSRASAAGGWNMPRRWPIAERLERLYEAGEFDVCTIVYNRFRSAITQELTFQQLIPVQPGEVEDGEAAGRGGQGGLRVRARARRRSSRSCCRATSRCRSTARWSRTRPASRAPG